MLSTSGVIPGWQLQLEVNPAALLPCSSYLRLRLHPLHLLPAGQLHCSLLVAPACLLPCVAHCCCCCCCCCCGCCTNCSPRSLGAGMSSALTSSTAGCCGRSSRPALAASTLCASRRARGSCDCSSPLSSSVTVAAVAAVVSSAFSESVARATLVRWPCSSFKQPCVGSSSMALCSCSSLRLWWYSCSSCCCSAACCSCGRCKMCSAFNSSGQLFNCMSAHLYAVKEQTVILTSFSMRS
jgi:hypothetical protein